MKDILKALLLFSVTTNIIFANAKLCTSGDPNCVLPGSQDRSTPFADQGQMAVYPKTYRSDGLLKIDTTNTTDAILAQTSYLARVLIQANDIYPPSHASSRSSGETFASAKVPLAYNVKALTQIASYRNALGAAKTSDQTANPSGTKRNDVDKIMRDWVDFHISNYCDPLAGSIGGAGLNNCNSSLNALDGGTIDSAKRVGQTSWDIVSGPYAADITANTLFSTKANPEAAMRYVYNVTNALPATFGNQTEKPRKYVIPDQYLMTVNGATNLNADGYKYYMHYLEEQSKKSLSQYAMMKILSERMKVNNIKIPVTKWLADGTKETSFEETSVLGLLEFESSKRFQDPAWFDRVQQMPTPALLKEIAYMLAMQNALDYKRYEQEQVQTALLASMTSDMSKLAKLVSSIPTPEESEARANELRDSYNSQLNNVFDKLRR